MEKPSNTPPTLVLCWSKEHSSGTERTPRALCHEGMKEEKEQVCEASETSSRWTAEGTKGRESRLGRESPLGTVMWRLKVGWVILSLQWHLAAPEASRQLQRRAEEPRTGPFHTDRPTDTAVLGGAATAASVPSACPGGC